MAGDFLVPQRTNWATWLALHLHLKNPTSQIGVHLLLFHDSVLIALAGSQNRSQVKLSRKFRPDSRYPFHLLNELKLWASA